MDCITGEDGDESGSEQLQADEERGEEKKEISANVEREVENYQKEVGIVMETMSLKQQA